jgi:YVTN family beta-propeller protein
MKPRNFQNFRNLLCTALLAVFSMGAAPGQPYAYVANISGNSVSVVNTANNTVSATISVPASPSGVAVTPDGNYVYVACQGANSVVVISTATNTIVSTIAVGTTPVQLAITPNGAQVYVVVRGLNQVAVIDTASNTVLGTVAVGNRPVAVAFNLNGSRAYVPNLYSGNVSVIDTASRTVLSAFTAGSGPSAVTVTPANKIYVSNQYSNSVTVHDMTGALLTSISGFAFPNWLAANPSGSRVFVSNGNSSSAGVIDTSSNTLMATVATGSSPTSVAVSSDGLNAYVVNEYSFTLSTISVATNAVMNTIQHVGVYPVAVATTPASGGPPQCTYSLSASSASFNAAGGTGSVNVTAGSGCAWTAVSNVNWAGITGGASGSGNGTVSFSVNSNGSANSLSGTLTIAGQTFTINEAGVPCSYSLSATSASFNSNGGTGSVNVTAPSGCAWTAVSNVGWTQVTSGASGNGNGSVNFSVNANNTANSLSGTLTVAGQTFTVNESGVACTYSLSTTSGSFNSNGGTGSVNVTAPSGCSWTAVSNQGWTQVTGGASGNGNGTVNYSVNANNSANSLSGTLTIAGQTYTVNESGVSCTFSLSATSASFNSTGGTGSVNVTAPVGCSWTAVSNQAWTQVTGGASGSGNGTVNFSVNANNGVNSISGTLTIAGQTFTINESGIACGYSLSASSASLGAAAGGGSVNVITSAGCGWTASSDSTSWLTVTAGSAGTGNGTVSFAVTANPGTASRTGNLTIGGLNFAVTQAGASFSPIRVRCGGPQYTDGSGNVWSPDNALNYNVTNAAIGNTTTPALYQTEAWSKTTLQYQYNVPNGSFTVKLHFAEFYLTNPGQRTFNIVVNGTTYYSSFDILSAVGPNTADDLTIPVVVNNGQITIQLVPVNGPAKVNAIEIF